MLLYYSKTEKMPQGVRPELVYDPVAKLLQLWYYHSNCGFDETIYNLNQTKRPVPISE